MSVQSGAIAVGVSNGVVSVIVLVTVGAGGILLPNPYVVSLDQHELKTKTYYRRGSGLPQHQRISRPCAPLSSKSA